MTDQEIQQGLLQQDELILNHLIKTYSPYLTAVCATIINPYHPGRNLEIEEVLQDVFIFIWQEPEKYKLEKSSLKTFLTLKTVNLAKNKIRKKSRRLLTEKRFLKQFETDGAINYATDLVGDIIAAILVLDEPTKEVMLRRFIFEDPPRKIKDEMSLSLKEINNRIYYGKKIIRQQLLPKGVSDYD